MEAMQSLTALLSQSYFAPMATLTIRNLPDEVRDRLRVRAAQNGRSMEAEAREALADALREKQSAKRASVEEPIAKAQKMFAPYQRAGVSLVDELLKERREAAERGD